MFTGIIERVGIIKNISINPQGGFLELEWNNTDSTDPIQLGESVCVNGICLTVSALSLIHI